MCWVILRRIELICLSLWMGNRSRLYKENNNSNRCSNQRAMHRIIAITPMWIAIKGILIQTISMVMLIIIAIPFCIRIRTTLIIIQIIIIIIIPIAIMIILIIMQITIITTEEVTITTTIPVRIIIITDTSSLKPNLIIDLVGSIKQSILTLFHLWALKIALCKPILKIKNM